MTSELGDGVGLWVGNGQNVDGISPLYEMVGIGDMGGTSHKLLMVGWGM